MSDLHRRLKKAEDRLNLNTKPRTVAIVQFGGRLPPDRTDGNTTIRHVAYEDIAKE